MALIRDRALASDPWRRAPPVDPPGSDTPRAADAGADHLLFSLGAEDDPAEIEADLGRLDVVAFEFGAFTEGRCYSRARLLRERYGYRGEIRALGDVSTDRLAFMERCGFNAFELRDDCDPREALAAFAELSDVYQPGADGAVTIPARRGLRGL